MTSPFTTSPLATSVCQLLSIQIPIVQAPIGSAATPELAAAVSNAGGLGTLALTWTPAEQARAQIRRTLALTDRPFAVNLVLDFPIDNILAACLDENVRLVSTFWGDPTPIVPRVHAAGALHLHTVGTVAEARQAADAGVDVIVAQGWEAGGHVRGEVSTFALVPSVVDAVGTVPVLAAGGIGDGRGLAAVLTLGAQAGWLGTRFLTAREANTHAVYRDLLLQAGAGDTAHTRCFDVGWPSAPHRVIRNSTLDAWENAGYPRGADRPGATDVVATTSDGRTYLRYTDMIPTAGATGNLEAMALYAGQSVGLTTEIASAAEIIVAIADRAAEILNRRQARQVV